MSQVFSMNVVDMRQRYRRSTVTQSKGTQFDRRKGADRRISNAQASSGISDNFKRIWLTPGERNLIEDLYLLGAEEK